MFDHMDSVGSIRNIKKGQLLVITRKLDKRRILVKCAGITNDNEVLLSKAKNDYFNFDMFLTGESWVWRVWALPSDIEITAITNNLKEFPR
jgi:hypothetical protein